MSDPFEDEDFSAEDEWVEISDGDGRKASLRHLATVRIDQKTYHVLARTREGEEKENALMLVRQDQTADGSDQYIIAGEEDEIERVVAHFVLHVIKKQIEDMNSSISDDDDVAPCGCRHLPGDFCYCGDHAYLQ